MLYLATDFWHRMLEEDEFIAFVAIVLGCTIALVAIVSGAMRSILVARAREATKRELAAYVAEGSLDPDKAVAMIEAGRTASAEAGNEGAA